MDKAMTDGYNGFREPTTTELLRVLEDANQDRSRLRDQVAAQADALAVVTADRDRRLAKLTEQPREEQDARADDRRGFDQSQAFRVSLHAEDLKLAREKAAEVDRQLRGQLKQVTDERNRAEGELAQLVGLLQRNAATIKGREARRAARPLLDLIPKPEPRPF